MTQLFSVNASAQLEVTLSVGGTSMELQAGGGALFQAPTGGDHELITLHNSDFSQWEVVKCTGRTNDTFTIERNQEGTQQQWGALSYVSSYITRGTIESFRDSIATNVTNISTNTTDIAAQAVEVAAIRASSDAVQTGLGRRGELAGGTATVTFNLTAAGNAEDLNGVPEQLFNVGNGKTWDGTVLDATITGHNLVPIMLSFPYENCLEIKRDSVVQTIQSFASEGGFIGDLEWDQDDVANDDTVYIRGHQFLEFSPPLLGTEVIEITGTIGSWESVQENQPLLRQAEEAIIANSNGTDARQWRIKYDTLVHIQGDTNTYASTDYTDGCYACVQSPTGDIYSFNSTGVSKFNESNTTITTQSVSWSPSGDNDFNTTATAFTDDTYYWRPIDTAGTKTYSRARWSDDVEVNTDLLEFNIMAGVVVNLEQTHAYGFDSTLSIVATNNFIRKIDLATNVSVTIPRVNINHGISSVASNFLGLCFDDDTAYFIEPDDNNAKRIRMNMATGVQVAIADMPVNTGDNALLLGGNTAVHCDGSYQGYMGLFCFNKLTETFAIDCVMPTNRLYETSAHVSSGSGYLGRDPNTVFMAAGIGWTRC